MTEGQAAPNIVVDQELCINCGACLDLCTSRVFGQDGGSVRAVTPEACWLCGHCVAACPGDAILHGDFPLADCPRLDAMPLPSLDALVAAFRERRSARVFDDRPVPREVVQELVDIDRWVPSGQNAQPVDWLVFDDPLRIAALSDQTVAVLAGTARLLRNPALRLLVRLVYGADKTRQALESAASFECMAERRAQGQDPIFRFAPVVLIAHVPRGDYFGRDHATYAVYNMMLAAQRLGLGTCPIGWLPVALERSKDLGRALGLPEGRQPEVVLTLGYPEYEFYRAIPRRQPELLWNP
jgi:nitroreductase/NAD-dependent dihydropyrimidine dehydrogenase PreA subunit